MRLASIGIQSVTMIECDARVPLLVFAKLHQIDVKDPVDLALVRRGRLIHAAFEDVAKRFGEAGKLADEAGVAAELSKTIARALPNMDEGIVAAQATCLATTIASQFASTPAAGVAHERNVSVVLATGIKLSGRIDTLIEGPAGWIIVERKSGDRRPWHVHQVQLYADMVEAVLPGRNVARLELWYSGREPGTVPVSRACGVRLAQVRRNAERGVNLDADTARCLCVE
jgi:RecB family exonuclease